MNLRQVELFLAVVDAGGFTPAAERLRVAQPAVSGAVRRLEQDLGAPLIARGVRRLSLTPEGVAFLRHARAVLGQVAAARREIGAMRALQAGQLTVGAPAMVAGYLLPRVVDGFLSEHPGLRICVVQAGAEEIGARVLRGDLDLGIIADWRTPEGLVTQPVEAHPMVACTSSASSLAQRERLTWTELIEQPLVLFPPGYHQRSRVEDAAARLGRLPNIVAEAESVPLIVELVRRGHGIATLLAAAAAGLPGVKVLRLPEDATVPVALCRRTDAPANAAAEAFEVFLLEHLADGGPSLP